METDALCWIGNALQMSLRNNFQNIISNESNDF